MLFLVLGAVVVAALLWKRSGEHKKLAETTHDLAQGHVIVTHPSAGQAENEIVLPGNLQAFNEASIFARTNGYLKAWYADIGAKVTEGQVLAEIEAPDVDAQLLQARASLTQARSNLEIANLNFERQKDLLAKKVASQQEFDQNRTNVDAMKAAVQAGEANLQNLTVQKDFQQLKAPFAGVVTHRSTDVGALISAANGAGAFPRCPHGHPAGVRVRATGLRGVRAGGFDGVPGLRGVPGRENPRQGRAHRRGD